ncbi:MAG: tRNA (5-methylaminomethyl-2-thiouridine)(34)-methyltransferase MnmD [Prolixibacteraceae bacterium]|jgi:tRNA U34 5-methylaminomethyl-2-thiouridine-forming methyltransferase MnmC|nr:tRNA (5-methylaminomethyl-2-thiouridine)(34)-methyltransferase MnmD [Prolixibacteraceae bacterium]
MLREIIKTEDGSHTFYLPEIDEHYHSTHGAIQESTHIFINAGLHKIEKKSVNILEVGFGTGLNALLSIIESERTQQKINYFGIEKFPLTEEEYSELNYSELTGFDCKPTFISMHDRNWNEEIKLTANFKLKKIQADILDFEFTTLPRFDLIFYDAFAPNKQADVWDKTIFEKIYHHSEQGAIFVTYCAQGAVRRNLIQAGFKVDRIPGPPGKREMLRAIK